MEILTLKAAERDTSNKGAIRRTREAGLFPGILYGGDGEPLAIAVDAKEFTKIVHGRSGEHAVVKLEIDGKPEFNSPALLKQVQHHPVNGRIQHVDLQRIRLDQRIKTSVPVELTGRAIGVIDGGVLDHQLREVEVECLAVDVPEALYLEITNLAMGDSIHVSDIALSENLIILTEGERAIAAIHAPRVVVAAPVEGEVEEGAAAVEGGAGESEGGGEK